MRILEIMLFHQNSGVEYSVLTHALRDFLRAFLNMQQAVEKRHRFHSGLSVRRRRVDIWIGLGWSTK